MTQTERPATQFNHTTPSSLRTPNLNSQNDFPPLETTNPTTTKEGYEDPGFEPTNDRNIDSESCSTSASSSTDHSHHSTNRPIRSNISMLPRQNSLHRSTQENQSSRNSKKKYTCKPTLDKPITLKRGMTRSHIHRYDIKLTIKKTRNDEDGEAAIQKTLQRLQEIMLQADPHTIIPPYFE